MYISRERRLTTKDGETIIMNDHRSIERTQEIYEQLKLRVEQNGGNSTMRRITS